MSISNLLVEEHDRDAAIELVMERLETTDLEAVEYVDNAILPLYQALSSLGNEGEVPTLVEVADYVALYTTDSIRSVTTTINLSQDRAYLLPETLISKLDDLEAFDPAEDAIPEEVTTTPSLLDVELDPNAYRVDEESVFVSREFRRDVTERGVLGGYGALMRDGHYVGQD